MLESKAAQERPLETQEVLFQIANFVGVTIKEKKGIMKVNIKCLSDYKRQANLFST